MELSELEPEPDPELGLDPEFGEFELGTGLFGACGSEFKEPEPEPTGSMVVTVVKVETVVPP